MDNIKPDHAYCAEALRGYKFKAIEDVSDSELEGDVTWLVAAVKRDDPRTGYTVLDLCSEKEANVLAEAMNKAMDEICT